MSTRQRSACRICSLTSQIAHLPLSPPLPEMVSQSQLTMPLHPHPIATVSLTLSRGLDRGPGNVSVKHAPHGVLGHSKVEALLPWPHGYHSTFILSPTLAPGKGASRSGCWACVRETDFPIPGPSLPLCTGPCELHSLPGFEYQYLCTSSYPISSRPF